MKSNFVIEHIYRYKIKWIYVIVSIIISSFSVLALGHAFYYFMDYGSIGIERPVYYVLAIGLALSISAYNRSKYTIHLCELLNLEIRNNFYSILLSVPARFYDNKSKSDIVSSVEIDTSAIVGIVNFFLTSGIRSAILFIGSIILLIYTNYKLCIYIMILLPLCVLPIIFVARKLRNISKEAQARLASIYSYFAERMDNIITVQLYNASKFEGNTLQNLSEEYMAIVKRRTRIRSFVVSSVIFVGFITIGAVLWLGGSYVQIGDMSSGDLMSYLFYTLLLASSSGSVSELYSDFIKSNASIDRLHCLEQEILSFGSISEETLEISDHIKSIRFHSVSYMFENATEGLHEIDFEISNNLKIAIVGKSGSGKSTILKMLSKLYLPTHGIIKINNIDIKHILNESIREKISLLEQSPAIFSGSLRYNICYGIREKITDSKILDMLHNMQLHDLLENVSLDDYLYDKAKTLSGGEKQKIALARALIRNPQLLLLDEATSAVDAESETIIMKYIKENIDSIVTVTHDIRLVSDYDLIIVLDGGRIVAKGRHDELVASSDYYQNLC